MVAIRALRYNFVRIHKSLRVSPAMAAGVTDRLWSVEDMMTLLDVLEVPSKRGSYKRRETPQMAA